MNLTELFYKLKVKYIDMNKNLILILIFLLVLNGCAVRVSYDGEKISDKNNFQSYSNLMHDNFKKFILKRNPKLNENIADNIIKYVIKYSGENNLSPKLVLALMAVESSFRADVVSKSGAIGLGQLLKTTAKDMGVDNPFDIEENIKATTKFLGKLSKHWNGNIDYSLASYKMGLMGAKNAINSWNGLPESTRKYISDIKKLNDSIE